MSFRIQVKGLTAWLALALLAAIIAIAAGTKNQSPATLLEPIGGLAFGNIDIASVALVSQSLDANNLQHHYGIKFIPQGAPEPVVAEFGHPKQVQFSAFDGNKWKKVLATYPVRPGPTKKLSEFVQHESAITTAFDIKENNCINFARRMICVAVRPANGNPVCHGAIVNKKDIKGAFEKYEAWTDVIKDKAMFDKAFDDIQNKADSFIC